MSSIISKPPTLNNTTAVHILCCICGISILPNPSNTCPSCLASQVDVTKGIQTEVTLHQCRGCQRWHVENGKWMACELESRPLMSLCLSNISGLHHHHHNAKSSSSKKDSSSEQNHHRLVDAAWIWTEPHSMRLKIRLTIQKQIQVETIIQQSFLVTFLIRNQQCIECQATFRTGSWKTVIQVRQRVKHKRTFLYLEQVILKHGIQKACLSIETFKDGMDFYFAERNKAAKFQSFLENVVPMKVKCSKKLIGMDDRNNVANYKYTHFVEIVPLCKDDLLYLPKELAHSLGNISRLVIIKNISEVIHVMDPLTCQTATFSADVYWRYESTHDLRPIITAHRSKFTSFIILGKEPIVVSSSSTPNYNNNNNTTKASSSTTTTSSIKSSLTTTNTKRRREVLIKRRNQRMNKLASLIVSREDDLGVNDTQFETISHMGYLMKSGDTAIGYDLTNIQFVHEEAEDARSKGLLPSIIILRKLYSVSPLSTSDITATAIMEGPSPKGKGTRMFTLQKLNVDRTSMKEEEGEKEEDITMATSKRGRNKSKGNINNTMDVDEEDEEEFLRQVEADKEMRANMNLFKSTHARGKFIQETVDDDDDDDDSDDQRIRLEELLDGLALDEGPDSSSTPNIDSNTHELVDMLDVEEGTRANRDGITFVGREESRRVQNKDVACAVPQFGPEFKSTMF